MMDLYLIIFIGILAMIVCLTYLGRLYDVPFYKCILVAVIMAVAGLFGSGIMHYIEAGQIGGRSLYGGIFSIPIVIFPTAYILGIPYGKLMDICTPSGCIMLMIMKIKCFYDGCCGGRVIRLGTNAFIFPSQIVEAIAFFLIGVFLFRLAVRKEHIGYLYSYFLIIYGITRFILNLLRETTPWMLGMAAGNIWSLVALAIGICMTVYLNSREKTIVH